MQGKTNINNNNNCWPHVRNAVWSPSSIFSSDPQCSCISSEVTIGFGHSGLFGHMHSPWKNEELKNKIAIKIAIKRIIKHNIESHLFKSPIFLSLVFNKNSYLLTRCFGSHSRKCAFVFLCQFIWRGGGMHRHIQTSSSSSFPFHSQPVASNSVPMGGFNMEGPKDALGQTTSSWQTFWRIYLEGDTLGLLFPVLGHKINKSGKKRQKLPPFFSSEFTFACIWHIPNRIGGKSAVGSLFQ